MREVETRSSVAERSSIEPASSRSSICGLLFFLRLEVGDLFGAHGLRRRDGIDHDGDVVLHEPVEDLRCEELEALPLHRHLRAEAKRLAMFRDGADETERALHP